MTTEIAKIESNLPAVSQEMGGQEILNSDIMIPQLLLMQGLSEFVSEKKKCPVTGVKIETGQFVRSTTMEILGGEEKPIRIIPLKMVANWKIEEEVSNKYEFRSIEPRTAANEMEPWHFEKNGARWRRMKILDVFALLPQDIEAFQNELKNLKDGEMPNLDKTLLPVVIRFKSTSFNAGKSVATFFAQVRDMQRYKPELRTYGYSLELSTYGDKNDDGQFYVFKVGGPKPLDKTMLPEAERWYNTLSALRNVRIDEAADDGDGSGVDGGAVC